MSVNICSYLPSPRALPLLLRQAADQKESQGQPKCLLGFCVVRLQSIEKGSRQQQLVLLHAVLKPQSKGREGNKLFSVTSRPLGPCHAGVGASSLAAAQGYPMMQGYALHISGRIKAPSILPCVVVFPPQPPHFHVVILSLNYKNSSMQDETTGLSSTGWSSPATAGDVSTSTSPSLVSCSSPCRDRLRGVQTLFV